MKPRKYTDTAVPPETQNSLNSSLGTGKLHITWLTEAKNGENGAFVKENVESVALR